MRGRCDSRLQSVLMNKMSSPYSDYSPSPRKKCYGQIVCNSNFHNVLWQNVSLVILIFFHAFVTNGIERDKIHRILLKLIYRKYSMKNTEYFNRESEKKSVVFNLLQNESQRTYPGYALSANPRLKISFLLKTKPWIETRQP